MKKFKALLVAVLFSAGTALPAAAGEGLFSYTYTTDTTPAGHFEFEQMIRNRAGRAEGSYSAGRAGRGRSVRAMVPDSHGNPRRHRFYLPVVFRIAFDAHAPGSAFKA